MKSYLSFVLLILVCSELSAQNKYDVLPYWKYYQPQTGYSYQLLMDRALEQLDQRNKRVAALKTASDWAAYRTRLKTQVKASLGDFPERTPLNPKVTSTLELRGVKVENLLYESLPGYFVSASFFKKSDLGEKKLPVIVFCSGHSANGYRSEGYQQMILNYVKKGFAVLAFDPIGQGERVQYRNADGKAAMGTTHDHSYSGSGAFLLGESPAKYFIWDGIRAIDYLETRNDVDMKRIGIAGRSGGGTQSSYIAALDDRVAAAAPECYITTYEMLLKSKGPQDAEQVFLNGLLNGIDIPDLLHMRAPKPTLVVTTTNDIFSVQGAHDVKAELSSFYKMAGVADHFEMVEDNAGHAPTKLNREACYRFFSKYLQNPCNTEDEEIQIFEDAQLYAAPGGDVFQIPGSKRLGDLIEASYKPSSATVDGETLGRLLNYTDDKNPVSFIFSGTILEKDYAVDKYLVKSPSGYYLPTLVFRKNESQGRRGSVVMYLHEEGKSADTGMILKLLSKNDLVVCADFSGTGELKEYYNWYGDALIQKTPLNLWYLGLLSGQTLAQYRLAEIGALSKFIEAKAPGVTVSATAVGASGIDLVHWATIHPKKLDKVVLVNPLLSYRSLLAGKEYKPSYYLHVGGGMLKHYDLPDLYSRFQSGKLRLINPVNSNGEVLDKSSSEAVGRIPSASLVFIKEAMDGI